ncbi:MAG: ParB/RepB/Spo0J family partition protein [Candidatus ainarchaeum sp.]|jgi:ParB family chromosome partitioning protein|nr:ParB/RepB/Spo0J family partition protein [Candidatus ainarchaeum sp.]
MVNKGLGRGLDSLIPKKINKNYSDFSVKPDNSLVEEKKNNIIEIDPNIISANPYQPRREFDPILLNDLINSIKEYGIIQPLIVTPKKDGTYELIAGERRLRSAIELNFDKVPVIVREVSEQRKLELALIENLQRENLNPIESAVAYNQLMNEFNLTQDDLARRLGKPRSSIANVLRFLSLPEEIKKALMKKQISEAHAKYLVGLPNEVKQLSIFRKIIFNNLSVRETDNLIRQSGGTKKAKINKKEKDGDWINSLRKYLNTKVDIKRSIKGGKIEISFYTDEDLNTLIKKIIKK